MNQIFIVLIFLVCLSSCSVGPSYIGPYVEIPKEWKNNDPCAECSQNQNDFSYLDFWWQVFNDSQLDDLEALAVENNRDLFVAFERIQEYRSLMGIAASQFYPQITLNPLYTNTGELIKNYANTSNLAVQGLTFKPFRVHELFYFLPMNLSYEVDLWGRIQDNYRSAKYNWLAQQKDYETTMLTLTSNLAFSYFQLRALDKQVDLLLQILQTRQKEYQINLDRYEGKIIFYSDVALAAEEVSSAYVTYYEVLRQRKVAEDQIAVLLGIPASLFCLEHMPLEGLPPCIPKGIPSEILQRRPDIAEAEYLARSAHQLIKEAYSQFFPSLTLNGTVGFESPLLKDFLKWISRYWMEGFQINQVIFDGFKTPYTLSVQIARFKEASGEYQQKVLKAFQEVEDALANLDFYAKEYNSSLSTVQWGQKVNQLYSDRYTLGVINYIDVVTTERDLLNFQINVNAFQGYRFMATVQLIKALGGGW